MTTNPEHEQLLRDFRQAGENLRKSQPTNKGGVGAEARYARAYQALVQAGLAPQLRRKYRTGGVA